jgi:hypothetical protein
MAAGSKYAGLPGIAAGRGRGEGWAGGQLQEVGTGPGTKETIVQKFARLRFRILLRSWTSWQRVWGSLGTWKGWTCTSGGGEGGSQLWLQGHVSQASLAIVWPDLVDRMELVGGMQEGVKQWEQVLNAIEQQLRETNKLLEDTDKMVKETRECFDTSLNGVDDKFAEL